MTECTEASSTLQSHIDTSHMKATPIKIGLTGSIGMGKSAISRQFRALGFRVFDADETVHQLYSPHGLAGALLAPHFPTAVKIDGSVDRNVLSSQVLMKTERLRLLESIIHPLVASERENFYDEACHDGCLAVVYDIPLLLEQGRSKHSVDYVVVVTASPETQRSRVLQRPLMTVDKFESIVAKQLPDAEKRKLADYVINTDFSGFVQARSQVADFIDLMVSQHNGTFDVWKKRVRNNLPKWNSNDSYLKKMFDIIVFDLDDTLVPVMGPIHEANQAVQTFVNNNMLKSAPTIDEHYTSKVKTVAKEQPMVAHDYTEIRTIAMTELCEHHDDEIDLVKEAIEIFVSNRSDLDSHLYVDTIPCLQHIWFENVAIGLFTNGNAVVPALCTPRTSIPESDECHRIPPPSTLSTLLTLSLNAGDVGAQKPSMIPFIAISQLSGIEPSRILYIGDNYEHDVVAAKQANFHTALLCRGKRDTCKEKCFVDGVHPDIILDSLCLDEFTAKIRNYIDKHEYLHSKASII